MTLVIRLAAPADGPALGEIHVAAWRAAYDGIMDATFLAQRDPVRVGERWSQILAGTADPNDGGPAPWSHLVAERDGAVVAMAAVGPGRDAGPGFPPAQLWMLNAHPEVFGTGAATALHAEAIARLGDHGAERAYLWVARDNPRARRFYEREGWTADVVEHVEELGGALVAEVRYVRELGARSQ